MLDAVSNTSLLIYLYRIEAVEYLPKLFSTVWIPAAVVDEITAGSLRGFDVPRLENYHWLQIVNPHSMPSEWLSLDVGPGEAAAMALALENRTRIIILDDMLARRTAQAAGLTVWGTLRVLLESKSQGIIEKVEPFITRLGEKGMWISEEIRERVLTIADELP